MPAFELNTEEVVEVLSRGQVVRVAFHDGTSPYLIPLGYVWLRSALFGVTESGRKTRIAAVNPTVAFQVDTSGATGVFEWASVVGEGLFGIVTDQAHRQQTFSALEPLIAQAPDWWQREQAPRVASGSLQVWRITPTRTAGRRYGPPQHR